MTGFPETAKGKVPKKEGRYQMLKQFLSKFGSFKQLSDQFCEDFKNLITLKQARKLQVAHIVKLTSLEAEQLTS